jgi:predicted PolB exonuclease-like 3'-5' exonuclease
MSMANPRVRYFVFDVESVADGALVSKVRYPDEDLQPDLAVARYRAELIESQGTDFIPYTFQIPVATAIAKVGADFRLLDLVVLDAPVYRPHVITEHFWRGWHRYGHPTFVSFNGRTFDLPLMELAAFRYGISVPAWFDERKRSWEQPRNRYNTQAHLDLHDLLVNFGAARFTGGLNLAANLLGKPGKMHIQGFMVQDLFNQGKLDQINDYCRCDVLDTYFVFLRSLVMVGKLDLSQEQQIIRDTKAWLYDRQDQSPAYPTYLESWGDWGNPWEEAPSQASRPKVASGQ